ncbi:alpha/beta fold hydrolase [Nocardiopsis composta]|uniref:alpha/beta fold hydrolase n=1 Tax=Nocardiopsis composta TaxID=157465 RepID=UPI0028AB9AD3|nr:alpha/beta hydrolase [Nocardiopsis composta]
MHIETIGPENAPTIVLAHGWTCATPFWAPVVNHLPDDLRIILYDQRGHGLSHRPAQRTAYTTTALADDLTAVLQTTLPDDTPAIIAGHSMGGMTLMAAADRPAFRNRAAAIALISTGATRLPHTSTVLPLFPTDSRPRAALHRLALTAPLPLGPKTPLTKAAIRYITMAPGSDPAMTDVCARIVHNCHPTARANWGRVLGTLELAHRLPHLDMPATLIHGTKDRLIPIPHAHHLHDTLPDARELIEIPDAAHMTPLEAPRTVADALTRLARTHLTTTTPTTGDKKNDKKAEAHA